MESLKFTRHSSEVTRSWKWNENPSLYTWGPIVVRKNIFFKTIFCVQCGLGVNLERKNVKHVDPIFWLFPAGEQSFAFSEFHSPSEKNFLSFQFLIFFNETKKVWKVDNIPFNISKIICLLRTGFMIQAEIVDFWHGFFQFAQRLS